MAYRVLLKDHFDHVRINFSWFTFCLFFLVFFNSCFINEPYKRTLPEVFVKG